MHLKLDSDIDIARWHNGEILHSIMPKGERWKKGQHVKFLGKDEKTILFEKNVCSVQKMEVKYIGIKAPFATIKNARVRVAHIFIDNRSLSTEERIKGKKRMKTVGSVSIPQSAFASILKADDN